MMIHTYRNFIVRGKTRHTHTMHAHRSYVHGMCDSYRKKTTKYNLCKQYNTPGQLHACMQYTAL